MNRNPARLLFLLLAFCGTVSFSSAQGPGPDAVPQVEQAPGELPVCIVETPPNSKPLEEGRITVGCPKVWRSDRVFTVLDGLLRDVDSITLKALQGLDPNEANEVLIESLVTDFQLKAKFDQAAAANNALKAQQIRAQRDAEMQNFKQKEESNKALIERRKVLADESVVLQKQELDLIKANTGSDADAKKLQNIQTQKQAVDTQIAEIDKSIATPTISDQSLSSTAATATDEVGKGTPLASLPPEFKTSLTDSLKKPTLPASMRMDNVIQLLHERLAREFSVMYDDLSRQTQDYDLYLLQFDIGLMPLHGAKDRQARIQLEFTNHAAIAYDLYPGASAYNTMRAMDKTSRLGLSGVAQTLFGFGVSAAFNREHNQLRSGLSQSLYVSGYGAGSSTFGWLIGPPPFDNFVNPGIRTVHAMLLVPKDKTGEPRGKTRRDLVLKVSYCWQKQEKRHSFWSFGDDEECTEDSQSTTVHVALPEEHSLHLANLSYSPNFKKDIPDSGSKPDDNPNPTNTIQLGFREPIDPNLTITVEDKIIRRVRDVRGRALFVSGAAADEKLAGNTNEQSMLSASRFGLLESDKLDPDTWMQVNSRTILLNIAKRTAGTDFFPVIRLADPGSAGSDLFDLASVDKDPVDSVRIGEWTFKKDSPKGSKPKDLPTSAYQPLFTEPYKSGRIKVYVDTIAADTADPTKHHPTSLRIISQTHVEGRTSPVWLHEQAQVILEPKGANAEEESWALHCDQESGSLSCKFPKDAGLEYERFKVWADQAPYFERPGLWADDDLIKGGSDWALQAYAWGDWTNVRETCNGVCKTSPWNEWLATIQLRNLDPAVSYCIPELAEIPARLKQLSISSKTAAYEPLVAIRDFRADPQMVCNKVAKGTQQEATSAIQIVSQERSTTQNGAVNGFVTLAIPFYTFPIVPETLHLCGGAAQTCDQITLPNLRSQLLPGPLKLRQLEGDNYRLEGDHLRSVDAKAGVLLQSKGKTRALDATVGYNNVDFSVSSGGKGLEPDQYNVFVVIAGVPVPALQMNDKKQLEQITLTYAQPKTAPK